MAWGKMTAGRAFLKQPLVRPVQQHSSSPRCRSPLVVRSVAPCDPRQRSAPAADLTSPWRLLPPPPPPPPVAWPRAHPLLARRWPRRKWWWWSPPCAPCSPCRPPPQSTTQSWSSCPRYGPARLTNSSAGVLGCGLRASSPFQNRIGEADLRPHAAATLLECTDHMPCAQHDMTRHVCTSLPAGVGGPTLCPAGAGGAYVRRHGVELQVGGLGADAGWEGCGRAVRHEAATILVRIYM